jgi:hypothetical protein
MRKIWVLLLIKLTRNYSGCFKKCYLIPRRPEIKLSLTSGSYHQKFLYKFELLPQYDMAYSFHAGKAKVVKDDIYSEITDPRLHAPKEEGFLASFADPNGKYGFKNKAGQPFAH